MNWSSFPNILLSQVNEPKPEDDHRWAVLIVRGEDRRYRKWVHCIVPDPGYFASGEDEPRWMPEEDARGLANAMGELGFYDMVFIVHAEEVGR